MPKKFKVKLFDFAKKTLYSLRIVALAGSGSGVWLIDL